MKNNILQGPPRWTLVPASIMTAFLAGWLVATWMWLPDVSYLILDNPKSTAYIRLYVQKTRAAGKKPVVIMHWVPLSEISPYLQKAVLVGEDDSFYKHGGVDWEALQKAMEYNRKKGRFARGASTITEQVARNLYLSPARNPVRKFKEILIARKLESALTKDRILEIYLNIAEWGKGIYGAQAASQMYFDKDAKDLSPDEAAALAAALPSPWSRNPRGGNKLLETKKEIILERMKKLGYIPPDVPLTDIDVPGTDAAAAPSTPAPKTTVPAPCDLPPAPPPILEPAPVKGAAAPKPGDMGAGADEAPESCGPGGPKPSSLLH